MAKRLSKSAALAKALKNLSSIVGGDGGITSITMSTPGSPPVVIDEAAAKRIRKNCDAIIRSEREKK